MTTNTKPATPLDLGQFEGTLQSAAAVNNARLVLLAECKRQREEIARLRLLLAATLDDLTRDHDSLDWKYAAIDNITAVLAATQGDA